MSAGQQPSPPEPPAGAEDQPAAAPGALERASAGLGAVLGDSFSLRDATGGWRGAVESSTPGLVFVVVFVATRNLTPALIAALAAALAATAVRLIQRSPVTQAVSGLLGVVIGVVWARLTGRGEDYFGWALITNLGYGLACLISIAARWPLVGLVIGAFTGRLATWREDRELYRRARAGTWLMTGMFALRLIVKVPLYFAGSVGWLGSMHLAMGLPLYALTLWLVWLLLRGHVTPAAAGGGDGDGDGDGREGGGPESREPE
ncbi:MAG: DUF3159 domain-containing protein [Bifidobacteriaceae bacterium]|nr:DUF3159 domain-containing protein [Bifidobacteriaceae bacterium]